MQDFSTVKYRGRNNAFFQRTVKVGIPQAEVIIKLTKMTKLWKLYTFIYW